MRHGKLAPWAYLAPALLVVGALLVYPVVNTIIISFFGRRSDEFVGFANYVELFTDPQMLLVFRNNAIWLFVFTGFTVFCGLALAILADRVKYESIAKSLVFMPMAISAAGASVIWKFVYAFRPPGTGQIGLLNAIVTGLGGEPIPWLAVQPMNNLFIIIVGVWMWTGFSMTVLSAAYKNIPTQFIESGKLAGASEAQMLRYVILPAMWPTIVAVTTTIMVIVLKIFDFVYVMTNGNFNTEVIANKMFKAMFRFNYFGQASALAVILFLLTLPVIIANTRRAARDE